MKFFTILVSLILISGCATIQKKREEKEKKGTFYDIEFRKEYVEKNADLKEKEKKEILEGNIPEGFTKKQVKELLGSPYDIYVSDTKMMEVWFYKDWYVGFDREGRVVKFGKFIKEEEKKD